MNHRIFFLLPVLLYPLLAQAEPGVWPLPNPLPKAPSGTPASAYPLPRLDWVEHFSDYKNRAQQTAGSIELIFDGDSITEGWQWNGKDIWAERYGKLNAFDFGIAGDGTQHLLWRLSQGQVENIKPKLVVIMIGINNLRLNNSVEDVAAGIEAIVKQYRKHCPEADILLQGIFPSGQNSDDPLRAKIKAVNESISKLADGKKVTYLDLGDKFLNADGSISPEIMGDFLHPTAKGYQIWADAIQPVIEEHFKK